MTLHLTPKLLAQFQHPPYKLHVFQMFLMQ
uniref:Uncharacterized protein n=1 Tax=Myoviridae sp. ctAys2 TaxID=2825044 RepID=A0A8S5Q4X9_9CAUD|nr:MAG TPA: hypothetical protein [Myoviridae sp. ctAys2]